MAGSPYRDPGPLPEAEGYWTTRRILIAGNIVVALAVPALLLFMRSGTFENRLTLADPRTTPHVAARGSPAAGSPSPATSDPLAEPADELEAAKASARAAAVAAWNARGDAGAGPTGCTCREGDPLCSCVSPPSAAGAGLQVGSAYLDPAPSDASAARPLAYGDAGAGSWQARTRAACAPLLDVPEAKEMVLVTIDGDGKVLTAEATGDSRAVGRCLEEQARSWVFPAIGVTTRVRLPVRFRRQ
jgi:hypothetical protein